MRKTNKRRTIPKNFPIFVLSYFISHGGSVRRTYLYVGIFYARSFRIRIFANIDIAASYPLDTV